MEVRVLTAGVSRIPWRRRDGAVFVDRLRVVQGETGQEAGCGSPNGGDDDEAPLLERDCHDDGSSCCVLMDTRGLIEGQQDDETADHEVAAHDRMVRLIRPRRQV